MKIFDEDPSLFVMTFFFVWCACENRNCHSSIGSFLVLEGKEDEAGAKDKLRHDNPSKVNIVDT